MSYYVANRKDKDYKRYKDVLEIIRQLQEKSGFISGKRVITRALRDFNVSLCVPTVARLMRMFDLTPTPQRKKNFSTYDPHAYSYVPDLVKRNFKASMPGVMFVTDVSQFKVRNEPIYLACVVDLFNNEIVSSSVGRSPSLKLCMDALKPALNRRNPEAPVVIHHSDNGFQYHHKDYKRALADAGFTQSMSRVGNCYDNGAMESIFGHIKHEMEEYYSYQSVESLAFNIMGFVEYYNTTRTQVVLDGLSPIAYRQKYEALRAIEKGSLNGEVNRAVNADESQLVNKSLELNQANG